MSWCHCWEPLHVLRKELSRSTYHSTCCLSTRGCSNAVPTYSSSSVSLCSDLKLIPKLLRCYKSQLHCLVHSTRASITVAYWTSIRKMWTIVAGRCWARMRSTSAVNCSWTKSKRQARQLAWIFSTGAKTKNSGYAVISRASRLSPIQSEGC